MKKLLLKEYKLTACPLTFFFILFSIMTMIPRYPILVGAFFVCLGILYTFQFAREDNDVLYTSLLPVAKSDVVKARYIFVISIEMISFIISLILTLVRMIYLSNAAAYADNPMMNANLVYLGSYLIIFALFNLIFVSGFFKTAYYFGKPFMYFSIASFVFIGLMEILHNIPGFSILNITDFSHMGLQLSFLISSIIIWCLMTGISLKKSILRFESIDL